MIDTSRAWVPFDEVDWNWDLAADLAAQWINDRAAEEGVRPLLVTNVMDRGSWPASISKFEQTSPRSSARFAGGPVVAFLPDERSIHFVMGKARNHSLVMVESAATPLMGWAAAVGAVNLTDGSGPPTLGDSLTKELEHVMFAGQGNGWTKPFEKQQARRYLAGVVRAGDIDAPTVVAYALGKGASDKGAKRLGAIVNELTPNAENEGAS